MDNTTEHQEQHKIGTTPNLTSPEARFFLWRRNPAPCVERRVYLYEVDRLDSAPDYLVSIALPGSNYYDLSKGRFLPEFEWVKDELNLMTVPEFQKAAQIARSVSPDLFKRKEPIVRKRYGTGGENKTAIIADVLGFSDLVRKNPHAYNHIHVEDPEHPELGVIEGMRTSDSHGVHVQLLWNLHRELFVADQAEKNPTYSHVASDSMLIIYDEFPSAIDAAARVLRWSLRHSEYSLRVGVGCGTFNSIPMSTAEGDQRLLASTTTTVALFYGTALLAAHDAEKRLGARRGPCIVLSETCEQTNPKGFRTLVDSCRIVRSRSGVDEANYLADIDPTEHQVLHEGLQRQRTMAVARSRNVQARYDAALDDFPPISGLSTVTCSYTCPAVIAGRGLPQPVAELEVRTLGGMLRFVLPRGSCRRPVASSSCYL